MRKLPRDLVLILRTEAKNQRTPPIDYVIAEDGGLMVHQPDPDIAMSELLEEAASALAAKDAELAEAVQEIEQLKNLVGDPEGTAAHAEAFLARAERAEAGERAAHDAANTAIRQRDEARAALAEARKALGMMLKEHDILSGNYDVACPVTGVMLPRNPDRWPTAAEAARRVLEGGKSDE